MIWYVLGFLLTAALLLIGVFAIVSMLFQIGPFG